MEKIIDILKFAIANEIKAKVFYGKASEITSDGESQMVFLELAHMEDGHARHLVDRFGPLMQQQGFDGNAFLQRRESETEKILDMQENDLITRGDMRSVLEFAMGMEIRARDSYQDLAARVSGTEERAFLENLAAEEHKHWDMLSKLRISVDTPIDERPAL
jgi:rubrerythrin